MATRSVARVVGGMGDWIIQNATGSLLNGDQTTGVDLGTTMFEKTVQVLGTIGAGFSIQAEQSNDGTNWVIIGAAITALGFIAANSAAKYMRVNVTAGDGTTAITAIIHAIPVRV